MTITPEYLYKIRMKVKILVSFQYPPSFYCMFPSREQKHPPNGSSALLEGCFL